MADPINTPLPADPLAPGQPVNAREFYAGLILHAIMMQPRNNTPAEAMEAAWDYADQFQYIGAWGHKREDYDGTDA